MAIGFESWGPFIFVCFANYSSQRDPFVIVLLVRSITLVRLCLGFVVYMQLGFNTC
jgi:hypothetical protein